MRRESFPTLWVFSSALTRILIAFHRTAFHCLVEPVSVEKPDFQGGMGLGGGAARFQGHTHTAGANITGQAPGQWRHLSPLARAQPRSPGFGSLPAVLPKQRAIWATVG
jgi:hypothetical protein